MEQNPQEPAPELEKLAYFVGEWICQGTIAPGPWGAGGQFRWSEYSDWMRGKFFVVGRWQYHIPSELGGDGEELFVMGYDPKRRVYTFDAFSSDGQHQVSKGTIRENTWTWRGEAICEGKTRQQKMTMRIVSETTYQLRFEVSDDGAEWRTFMEGQATRTAARQTKQKSPGPF